MNYNVETRKIIVKVDHGDEDYEEIMTHAELLKKATSDAGSEHPILIKIRDIENKVDKGINEITLEYPVVEKPKQSKKLDYGMFGLLHSPDTGFLYLSESPSEVFVPFVSFKDIFRVNFMEIVKSQVSPGDKDDFIEFVEKKIRKISLSDFDSVLQDLKLGTANQETYNILSGSKTDDASRDSDLLRSRTISEMLFKLKDAEDVDEDEADFRLSEFKGYFDISTVTDDSKSIIEDVMLSILSDVGRVSERFIRFFALLKDANLPHDSMLQPLVLNCENVKSTFLDEVGALTSNDIAMSGWADDVHTLTEGDSKFRTYLIHADSESFQESGTNPFFNPNVREIFSCTDLDDIREKRNEHDSHIKVANLSDFTNFPDNAVLTGAGIIPEPSREDYDHILEHLEDKRDVLEAKSLSLNSIKQSFENVIASKMVPEDQFNRFLKTVEEKVELIPIVGGLLTKQVSDALYKIYQTLTTKAF